MQLSRTKGRIAENRWWPGSIVRVTLPDFLPFSKNGKKKTQRAEFNKLQLRAADKARRGGYIFVISFGLLFRSLFFNAPPLRRKGRCVFGLLRDGYSVPKKAAHPLNWIACTYLTWSPYTARYIFFSLRFPVSPYPLNLSAILTDYSLAQFIFLNSLIDFDVISC